MQYACHHAHSLATAPGFHSDPTSLLNSLGPLGIFGLLFAGVLATLFFLLWTSQYEQPAHAEMGGFIDSEHRRQEGTHPERGPHISFARYEQASKPYQPPYEQPQAHYPEMPPDEPPPPGKYD
ncbi:MAG TPA: hypothetical protein VKX46_05355 [Ktedonobacteraceae bacterium]|jgi:hypothetical protein|nr:hypothetical protein [Ktedonobacteraceae bacterium]